MVKSHALDINVATRTHHIRTHCPSLVGGYNGLRVLVWVLQVFVCTMDYEYATGVLQYGRHCTCFLGSVARCVYMWLKQMIMPFVNRKA